MKAAESIQGARNNIERAKKCLELISNIAAGTACARNPEHVAYALQELSQVLFDAAGTMSVF